MVDREIVLETVKKMYESGIEDDIVKQTLKDIGLGEAEIAQYIAEAKGVFPAQAAEPFPRAAAARPAARLPRPAFSEEREAQEAMHTTTHVALEQQAARTDELIAKISGIESRLVRQPAKCSPCSRAQAPREWQEGCKGRCPFPRYAIGLPLMVYARPEQHGDVPATPESPIQLLMRTHGKSDIPKMVCPKAS